MKKFLSPFRLAAFALGLLCLAPPARAQVQQLSITVTVTNNANITTNDIMNIGGTNAYFNTSQLSVVTNVLIGSTAAATAQNLYNFYNTNLTSLTWYYYPGSAIFQGRAAPGASLTNNIITTNTATLVGGIGTWGSAILNTNANASFSGPANGFLTTTNLAVTISQPFTLINNTAVSGTNTATLPSLTTLQGGYSPGATFFIRWIDPSMGAHVLATQAGTGTSLIYTNSLNNNYVAAILPTNGFEAYWTWDGNTNMVMHQ